jgi:dihydrofolate reductase
LHFFPKFTNLTPFRFDSRPREAASFIFHGLLAVFLPPSSLSSFLPLLDILQHALYQIDIPPDVEFVVGWETYPDDIPKFDQRGNIVQENGATSDGDVDVNDSEEKAIDSVDENEGGYIVGGVIFVGEESVEEESKNEIEETAVNEDEEVGYGEGEGFDFPDFEVEEGQEEQQEDTIPDNIMELAFLLRVKLLASLPRSSTYKTRRKEQFETLSV